VSITAQIQWTDPLRITGKGIVTLEQTNLVATITLQAKPDGGSNWIEVDTVAITAATEGRYEFEGGNILHRVGVATGDYTSGAAILYLSK
jgi:hypothetical protein